MSTENTIKGVQHIHFIGIGGIGISALAKMLLHQGKTVSGVNDSESPETLDELRAKAVQIDIISDGEDACPAPDGVGVYVYSVAWEGRAPEVLEAARATGKPVLSYFEALGEIAKEYKVVAISGTHGKTTTTAMTAQALIAAGFDPTVIVGSLVDWRECPRGLLGHSRSNFRAGNSELLVVEACEYKRHFLHFDPYIFAVTNIELDHPDYYKDLADVEDAFATVASQSEIVLTQDSIENFVPRVPELKLHGEHNVKNAALALAICEELGADLPDRQAGMEKAKEALAEFSGTWRRFEYIGKTESGAKVYDDYAHHPTAIKATLKAAKETHPNSKIIAVFEPHMFSRTQAFFKEFGSAFAGADEVIIAPIYAAREAPIEDITAETLAQEVATYRNNAQAAGTITEASELARQLAGKGDVILFMGAGNIYKIAENSMRTF